MNDETPLSPEDAQTLRFLKRLVTVLTATMICGVLAIVALLVIRLNAEPAPGLPDALLLPDGAKPIAFTQGGTWIAVVTEDDRILVYNRAGTTLLQEIEVTAP